MRADDKRLQAQKQLQNLLSNVDRFGASVLELQEALVLAETSFEADVKQLSRLDQKVLSLTLMLEKYMKIIRDRSSHYQSCQITATNEDS